MTQPAASLDERRERVAAPWSLTPEALLDRLEVDPLRGLDAGEAARRLADHGPNTLACADRQSAWAMVLHQLRSPLVGLLVVAAIVALALGETVEAVAVLVVVVLNAAIGFATERRATRSMEALRRLGAVRTLVRRGGVAQLVPADELVPGDLVVLEAGDLVTADLRLVTASRLAADESALTGESLPVSKAPQPVPADAPLPERSPMLHRGTALARGAGLGLVVATGMDTELGRISALVAGAEAEATPLERRLDLLARRLIGLTVVVAALVGAAILSSGRGLYLAVETGIALAVATIPEGLPIVATLALARGMWRMARRNALIENLASVETLGATTVILTDKTGTLTENRMTAVELVLAPSSRAASGAAEPADTPGIRVEVSGTGLARVGEFRVRGEVRDPAEVPGLYAALRAGVLCCNAELGPEPDQQAATGDPTEVALLVAGAKAGLDRATLLVDLPERHQEAFDPDTLRMATVHGDGDGLLVAVKGAPEAVLACCDREGPAEAEGAPLDGTRREAWRMAAAELAERGRRVLGLAEGRRSGPADLDRPTFEDLSFLGLVALEDPPREDVPAAVEGCRRAGIRLVMVTGDHGATGRAIAEAVGLVEPGEGPAFVDGREVGDLDALDEAARDELLAAPVFARATPEQKLDLIELHQRRGQVVAMTGDGVNDAPALKEADIGIAMGQRGTQVACEAADMVLRDDRLVTIVAAIGQGRAIFANIRKFVVYLLSCNVSEILVVGLGVLLQGPMPLLPLQILFLNLVTDVFPALALGGCEGSPTLMERPPRDPAEPILTRRHWRGILSMGVVIALCTITAMILALEVFDLPAEVASTVAFLALALAQLWLVLGMRARGGHPLRNEVTRNRWVWAALVLCVVLVLVALYVPVLAHALTLTAPGVVGWSLALGASVVPAVVAMAALGPAGRGRRAG